MNNSSSNVLSDDLFDIAALCHAAMAQDSPNSPLHYLNQVMNLVFPYLTKDQKQEIEDYLADKKYLPPVEITIANK